MRRTVQTLIAVGAAGALAALPATGLAHKPDHPGKSDESHGKAHDNHGKGEAKRCAKTHRVGFSVHGTLVSFTADNPATPANEGTVTIKVTSANRHATNSGDIADQDAVKPGVQVAGATYTVPTSDAFKVKLVDFQGADTPSVGDSVHITGKIALTKAKCAPAGTSLADRYGAVDVRKVRITDRDPD
jgi:hypothetical protein